MDKIEAAKNLKRFELEIDKYQSLSRGLMSRDEMIMVDKKITLLKEWSKSIKSMLEQ